MFSGWFATFTVHTSHHCPHLSFTVHTSHSLVTPLIHCPHLSFTVHTSHSLVTSLITVHTSLVLSPRVVYATLVPLYQQWYEVKIQISWYYQLLAYFFLTFYFMCMNVISAGMTVHYTYLVYSRATRCPGTGVMVAVRYHVDSRHENQLSERAGALNY